MHAIDAYAPLPLAGRVHLFRTQTLSLLRADDPQMGWGRLARHGVIIHKIPGAHYNILQPPYVSTLARELARALGDSSAD